MRIPFTAIWPLSRISRFFQVKRDASTVTPGRLVTLPPRRNKVRLKADPRQIAQEVADGPDRRDRARRVPSFDLRPAVRPAVQSFPGQGRGAVAVPYGHAADVPGGPRRGRDADRPGGPAL